MTVKKRRNSEEVDRAIFIATKELVEENGFANLALTQIAKRAKVSPNMFYSRYPDLEKLLIEFIHKYDYWFTDILNFEFDKTNYQEYYKSVLENLNISLLENKTMQELLIFELTNHNPLTRRTTGLRELDTEILLSEYDKHFENSSIDIRANTAILISGIYHLIIRQNISLFCGIDLSTPEGQERIRKTIVYICDKIFDIRNLEIKTKEIAKELLKNGVDTSIIVNSTGLSLEEITELKL